MVASFTLLVADRDADGILIARSHSPFAPRTQHLWGTSTSCRPAARTALGNTHAPGSVRESHGPSATTGMRKPRHRCRSSPPWYRDRSVWQVSTSGGLGCSPDFR
ncbi:hypothetical protein BPSY_2225 [Bifidobacterium psychraerophilum]|uniref:Uncharacterized protein n=1 Tax=Bifidobacterium psychraerophilum TaxID=218140 RepID=A0A087CG78_9BIFI|nr:hypothetical protein BPSY_2225 [Bifidobacterium psychraerophilum]